MREAMKTLYATGSIKAAKIERSVIGHVAEGNVDACKLDRKMIKGFLKSIAELRTQENKADKTRLREWTNTERVLNRALEKLGTIEAGVCECCGDTVMASRLHKDTGMGFLCDSCYMTMQEDGLLRNASGESADADGLE